MIFLDFFVVLEVGTVGLESTPSWSSPASPLRASVLDAGLDAGQGCVGGCLKEGRWLR
jgi:hypothetical protein